MNQIVGKKACHANTKRNNIMVPNTSTKLLSNQQQVYQGFAKKTKIGECFRAQGEDTCKTHGETTVSLGFLVLANLVQGIEASLQTEWGGWQPENWGVPLDEHDITPWKLYIESHTQSDALEMGEV